MSPAEIVVLVEKAAEHVPEPVWDALGKAIQSAFEGDDRQATLHIQAAAARQAAHLALHAKGPKP